MLLLCTNNNNPPSKVTSRLWVSYPFRSAVMDSSRESFRLPNRLPEKIPRTCNLDYSLVVRIRGLSTDIGCHRWCLEFHPFVIECSHLVLSSAPLCYVIHDRKVCKDHSISVSLLPCKDFPVGFLPSGGTTIEQK